MNRARPFQPLRLLDLELSDPIADVSRCERFGAVRLLVRLRGTPLGWLDLPLLDGRCPAERIERAAAGRSRAAIRRELAYLLTAAPVPPGGRPPGELLAAASPAARAARPSLTVAVCTRDRTESLERCLGSLLRMAGERPELLVIDNAPGSEDTRRLIARYPAVRYLREEMPGLNNARNRAMREATGDVLAFTDDDVEADRNWAEALRQLFAGAPEAAVVTGLVVPLELDTPAQLDFEAFGGFGFGFRRVWNRAPGGRHAALHFGATGRFGTGANMAFRREALDRIGGVDPALDVGTATGGGGDLEIFFRAIKAGLLLVQEPRALVRHRHRPEHMALRAQLSTWGSAMYAYVLRSCRAYPEEIPGFLWTTSRELGLRNPRRLLQLLVRPRYPAALLWDEIKGIPLAPWRLRRARLEAQRIGAVAGAGSSRGFAPPLPAEAARPVGGSAASIDLGEPLPRLGFGEDVRRATIDVACGERRLGRIIVDPLGTVLPLPRLRDALADQLTDPLLSLLRAPASGGRGLPPILAAAAGLTPAAAGSPGAAGTARGAEAQSRLRAGAWR